jgi:peptide/nickel transport system permease protein
MDLPERVSVKIRGTGRWERVIRILLGSRTATFGFALSVLLVFTALLAPWIAPYRPDEIHPIDSLVAPSARYWLGTDDLGRDILSRLIFGARVSLMVGTIAIGIAALAGVSLGLAAGYLGGRIDGLIMRVMDALLAFPAILLAIALMAVLSPSLENAMIAIGIISVPAFARITRANVLSLREKEFVEASRALGGGGLYLSSLVILPNCLSPIIVQASLGVGNAILVEAALSFLGLGVQPPEPSWGSMLAFGRSLLGQAPWYATFSGLSIFVTVLGLNFLGDGLREALDPRLHAAEHGA